MEPTNVYKDYINS